jgi:AcrR family transcriptional regulator
LTRVKTDAKRNEILAAARQAFAENGFHVATIGDIAGRLGASKATIYNYFSSKTALFWEMLADQAAPVMTDILAKLEGDHPFSIRLRAFCVGYLELFTMPVTIDVQRLMIAEAGRSGGPASLRNRSDVPGWKEVTNFLRSAQEAGDIGSGDVTVMSMHLRALLEGGLPLRHLYGETEANADIDEIAHGIADFFLCGYAAR